MLTTVSLRPERSRARASAVDERGVSPARSSARRAAGFVLATVAIALGVLALLLTAASAAAVDALVLGVRAAGTGAGLVAVGVLAFLVLVHDGHGREAADLGRLLRWAALTGIAAAVMRLPLEAATVAGTGLSGVTEPGVWPIVAATGGFASAAVRIVGLAGLCIVATRPEQLLLYPRSRRGPRRHPVRLGIATAGAVLVVTSFILTGHAATGQPQLLIVPAHLLHTATASLWLGGLAALATVLRRREDPAGVATVVTRFSSVAAVAVAGLVPAGVLLGWSELGSLSALTGSGYGRTLLLKSAPVVVVLAVAAYNRWRLAPSIHTGGDEARPRLRRTLVVEISGLGLAVLATAALTVSQPPG